MDLVRGYRVCAYNHEKHGGTHVHRDLGGGEIFPVNLESADEAEVVMGRFARISRAFDEKGFREVVRKWRSELRKG